MHRLFLTLACSLIAVPVASGYVLYGYRWPVREIPYYVNPTNLDVPANHALAAVQWAANAWSDQSNADVRWVYAGLSEAQVPSLNGRSEVMFRNVVSPNGDVGGAFRYVDREKNAFLETDLVFYDGGYTFFTTALGGCSTSSLVKGHFIEAIGIHEFGHMLGIGHSDVLTATMRGGATRCSTEKMSLDTDDIAAVEALYPSTTPDPTPDPDPEESGQLTLTTKPPKVTVVLNWAGASGASVDVYVNGIKYGTTPNDGAQSVTLTGAAPWQVKVCEVGSVTACSAAMNISL